LAAESLINNTTPSEAKRRPRSQSILKDATRFIAGNVCSTILKGVRRSRAGFINSYNLATA